MRSAVIVVGGSPPDHLALRRLPADATVIAADSGFDHALALGLRVDHLVGDLDSVSPSGLAAARRSGVDVRRHPTDKDATDTELAIDLALATGCTQLVGLSGGGDRLDHSLATILAFTSPRLGAVDVELRVGAERIVALHGPAARSFALEVLDTVTLLPLHGDAIGVRTSGLRYPLDDEDLAAGTSRGVSNVATARLATVSLRAGTLAVITPLSSEEPEVSR